MECDGERTARKHLFQSHQPPGLVRQNEGWHRLARPRRIRSGAALGQAPDEVVDGVGVGRYEIPNRLRVGTNLTESEKGATTSD
jgi:hypothetical protein